MYCQPCYRVYLTSNVILNIIVTDFKKIKKIELCIVQRVITNSEFQE